MNETARTAGDPHREKDITLLGFFLMIEVVPRRQ